MTITSLPFLGFNLIAVVLFILFPPRYRWISLLISSAAFYWISLSDKRILVFVLLTSLSIWFTTRLMDRSKDKYEQILGSPDLDKSHKKEIRKKMAGERRKLLIIALILNVGILIGFKFFRYYADAFAAVSALVTGRSAADVRAIIMPLGISYYTFSTIGYLLDIYWRRYSSEKNYVRFLLFTIYYPHILQGPISRYTKLGAELKKGELHFTWDHFVSGSERILLGVFKKLVIADRAGVFVSKTLLTDGLHGSVYLLALALDAIQIYADFSGYMDIVSGVSCFFDVEMEQNFNHPFFARSVPEFWRRWHMSLGSWFKDYVYYPITLSKPVKELNKRARSWKSPHLRTMAAVIVPIMITWLLTGLWHGTGKGYVAWGIYYGTLITLSVTFSDDIQHLLNILHVNTECFSYRLFQTIKIFIIFMGGRFLGTTMEMRHRIEIFKSMRSFLEADMLQYGLTQFDFKVLAAGICLLVIAGVIESNEDLFSWFNRQNRIFCAVILYLMMFAVFLFGIFGTRYDTSGFMYQQF